MAYSLSNKYAKNLCKRTVLVQLIIENVVTRFFWNTVYNLLPKNVKIWLLVLIQYTNVTNGRTDGQTSRFCIALRSKKPTSSHKLTHRHSSCSSDRDIPRPCCYVIAYFLSPTLLRYTDGRRVRSQTLIRNVKACGSLADCNRERSCASGLTSHQTSSSAVAERTRDDSCLPVVSFSSTRRRAHSSIISYFGFRFTAVYN